MISLEIKRDNDSNLIFVTFNEDENTVSYMGNEINNNIYIEKFLFGKYEKTEFQNLNDTITLGFKKKGKGKLSKKSETDFRCFISRCIELL